MKHIPGEVFVCKKLLQGKFNLKFLTSFEAILVTQRRSNKSSQVTNISTDHLLPGNIQRLRMSERGGI